MSENEQNPYKLHEELINEIEEHPYIGIEKIDFRQTPIYDVNDIDLKKIRLSKLIKLKHTSKVYLLYEKSPNLYTRFNFETPFCLSAFGMEEKKNKINNTSKYWIKSEFLKYSDLLNDDYKIYMFYQYLSEYIKIKLPEFYGKNNETFMDFLSTSKTMEFPLTRYMINYKKHFITVCLDKTGRHITPYEIPKDVYIKFLLNPFEIWSNNKYYGGTWIISKMMIDKMI